MVCFVVCVEVRMSDWLVFDVLYLIVLNWIIGDMIVCIFGSLVWIVFIKCFDVLIGCVIRSVGIFWFVRIVLYVS